MKIFLYNNIIEKNQTKIQMDVVDGNIFFTVLRYYTNKPINSEQIEKIKQHLEDIFLKDEKKYIGFNDADHVFPIKSIFGLIDEKYNEELKTKILDSVFTLISKTNDKQLKLYCNNAQTVLNNLQYFFETNKIKEKKQNNQKWSLWENLTKFCLEYYDSINEEINEATIRRIIRDKENMPQIKFNKDEMTFSENTIESIKKLNLKTKIRNQLDFTNEKQTKIKI